MVAVPFDLAYPGWCRRMCRNGFSDVVHAALLAAGTRIEYKDFHGLIGPLPIPDFRQVVSMFADVLLVLNELVAQELFEMCAHALQARDAVDYIACEVKSIQIVQDCHIEGSRRRALSRTGHHHVRIASLVVRSPLPDSDSIRAMLDGRSHIEPL